MFIRLLKPLSFLPAILLMYMIFSFSAQDGAASSQISYKVSHKIVEVGGELLGAGFEPWEVDSLATRFHGPIRKIAHMTEYFALAIAVSFPLYVYGLRGILLMLVAGIICVGFACGDEYHQSYVAGRGPSKKDVLIDSFGVFWGIILVRIVGWTGRKTIFRPFGRKKARMQEIPQMEPVYMNNGPQQPYPYPGQPQYHNGAPYPNGVSYYPPRRGGMPEGAPAQGYGNAPAYSSAPNTYANMPSGSSAPGAYTNMPSYGNAPGAYTNMPPYGSAPGGGPQMHPAHQKRKAGTSDRLSEDMSLRKLMHDIKEQKSEAHQNDESV